MSNNQINRILAKKKYHWLITGVAGFIGSNLLEELLINNQKVTGIDNLSNGYIDNLNDVKKNVTLKQWKNFKFIKADICDLNSYNKYVKKIDFTLHQAARGSVLKSIKDPVKTNQSFGTPHDLASMHQKREGEMPEGGWPGSGRPKEATKYSASFFKSAINFYVREFDAK